MPYFRAHPPAEEWLLPPSGVIKLNVDGDCSAEMDRSGFGIVAHNAMGDSLGVKASVVARPGDPLASELHALMEGLKWACAKELERVVLESDRLLVVHFAPNLEKCISFHKRVLELILTLPENFAQLSLTHARRSANKATHTIVKFSLSDSILLDEWGLDPPDCTQ